MTPIDPISFQTYPFYQRSHFEVSDWIVFFILMNIYIWVCFYSPYDHTIRYDIICCFYSFQMTLYLIHILQLTK